MLILETHRTNFVMKLFGIFAVILSAFGHKMTTDYTSKRIIIVAKFLDCFKVYHWIFHPSIHCELWKWSLIVVKQLLVTSFEKLFMKTSHSTRLKDATEFWNFKIVVHNQKDMKSIGSAVLIYWYFFNCYKNHQILHWIALKITRFIIRIVIKDKETTVSILFLTALI